ncbi:MAG TPA: CTP synthase, partial [Phaeodactylibacter sp.]|nr:CTP synthase [Phaeodactylibacter sp.]
IDAETIYDVPILMQKEKLDATVINKLRLPDKQEPKLDKWKDFLTKLKNPKREIRIGLIGKYNELQDAYKSIYESFIHSGAVNECKVIVEAIHSQALEGDEDCIAQKLKHLDGILVAPGFGERGIKGKLRSIRFVRENKIPFFGICLGMQCAVVEFAQNVLGLEDAASTEVDPLAKNPVIYLMPEQFNISNKGGTMRLGAFDCSLEKGSLSEQAYGKSLISERHRHRYEFNNDYKEDINAAGLRTVGLNPQTGLVEVVELQGHPWFVGVQFHPELKSTVEAPHPLFVSFVAACAKHHEAKQLKTAETHS